MTQEELLFEITKTRNNIKRHVYSVADYKLCEKESVIVLKALDTYLDAIKNHDYDVVTTMEKSTNESWDKMIEGMRT